MSTASVADGLVVLMEYTLKNGEGEVLDASEGEPLAYLHGAENIVPGLEAALTGKAVGDELSVKVAAADGYGERVGGGAQPIERSSFPADAELFEGMSFAVETEQGVMPLWVVEVQEEVVMVDANHPLAGVELNFDVKVVAIREATDDEKEHGHPHGPEGHDHH